MATSVPTHKPRLPALASGVMLCPWESPKLWGIRAGGHVSPGRLLNGLSAYVEESRDLRAGLLGYRLRYNACPCPPLFPSGPI